MKKSLALLLASMVLAGCSSLNHVNSEALANRNFVLKSMDGVAVKPHEGMKPGIHFSEDMRVTGVMCNRFFGQGALENGVLSVPQMASTRMMCADPELNAWETAIGQMLTRGATLTLQQNTLTLTGKEHALVYVADN